MAKKNYAELASKILDAIGGGENVTLCEHCITRVRFRLKDKSLVNEDALNNLEGTNGCLWVGEQLQVIIGTAVNGVYDEVCKQGHIATSTAIKENLDKPKEKLTVKGAFQAVITTLTECIVPCLGVMVAMGMFAAVVSIIGPTGLNVVSVDSGVYKLFSFAQDAIMFFMPAVIAYSAAKKFNCSPVFAIMLACIQLSSDWVAGVTDGSLNPLGFAPTAITLNSQVIPVILEIFLMSKIEKLLNKIIPDNLKFVFVGTLELMIMLPIALYILTPLGTTVGFVIASPIKALESVSPPLVSFIAGGLYTVFIAFGMHSALAGLFVMDMFTTGSDYSLLPVVFTQCWLVAAVDIAVMLKTKDKALKTTAKECAVSAIVGGVMEPSIYAIYLKNMKIMVIACLAHGITGMVHRILGVGVFALSASNFLGATAFLAGGMDNLLRAIPGVLAGIAAAFIMVFVFGVDKKDKPAVKAQ